MAKQALLGVVLAAFAAISPAQALSETEEDYITATVGAEFLFFVCNDYLPNAKRLLMEGAELQRAEGTLLADQPIQRRQFGCGRKIKSGGIRSAVELCRGKRDRRADIRLHGSRFRRTRIRIGFHRFLREFN
jgi:hypothetical protein